MKTLWHHRDQNTGLLGKNRPRRITLGNKYLVVSLIFEGNVIDIQTGEWVGQQAGVGAGLDSFWEYLLKVRIG